MTASLVVTGIGMVNAAGVNAKSYWETTASGPVTPTPVHLFGRAQPTQQVMAVDEDAIDHGYTRRQVKKLDRLTLLATAAIRDALTDARLATEPADLERIGIFVGNSTAGWGYVEPQLYPLYRDDDPAAVNPYVATAWFPTAAQGEVSITHAFGGFSKTFAAENLSAAFALRHACWALDRGILDVAVVCGAEAPLTPLVYNACIRQGLVSRDGGYLPYRFEADGAPLGEGAAAVVVESADHARRRRVEPVATVRPPVLGGDRARVVSGALAAAGGGPIDYVALEGRAEAEADARELAALEDAFAGELPVMGVPAGSTGALIGATFLTGVALAAMGIRHAALPGGMRLLAGHGDRPALQPWTPPGAADVRSCLVLASDGREQSGAVVVSGPGAR